MNLRRINHIGVFQTAKVLAAISFVLVLMGMLFTALVGIFTGNFEYTLPEAIIILVLTPVCAFIGHAIMFWFYNLVASWVGGIEVQLKDSK